MGPNYANLFVGYVEKQIFEPYTDALPDYFGWYADDCCGRLHHILMANLSSLITMLIISIMLSSSHGRSVRPVYHS